MFKHSLLVWLFTCITGTMVLGGYFAYEEGGFKGSDMEAFVMIALAITLVASIPAMILYGLLMGELRHRMPPSQVKQIGSGYAVVATASSFIIVFGMLSRGFPDTESIAMMLVALPYALCFALAVWIIPMPESPRVPHSEGEDGGQDLPTSPPMGYYIIAGISALLLLYGLSTIFTGGILRSYGMAFPRAILHLLDLVVWAAALVLFLRWKSMGWKLITALSAAGLSGMLLSIPSASSMLTQHGGQLWRYYIPMLTFGLLDGVALFLLSRPDLRTRFRTGIKDYGIWILVGIAYAVIRMGVYRGIG